MSPLVSIIIPTFNRSNLISDTLDSIIRQTYINWECIIVDDGSSDYTDEIMESYTERDKRFKYYHRPSEHLSGGNGARNYGFLMSTGEYIQWFDSDDIMAPDFIEAKIEPFIESSDIDVVFSAFENVNEKGERTRIANQSFSGNILNDLVDRNVSFGPWSFMLRRDKVDKIKYDETLKKNQDLDFFFRFFTSSSDLKIIHVKKILYTVRSHSGSMTYRSEKDISKMVSIYKVYLMVLNYFMEQNHLKGIKRYKYKCLNSLNVMLRNGYYREAIKRLMSFRYLSTLQKSYLMGCVLSQFLINRGANQFSKIDSKNHLILKQR
ncbi:glycosyltransferase family 2 protein [Psychroserpens burtonensis]|uniref:Glycosyltransferase family 2 protein n=1 Tax=Psychroserpens burtonensis TaxID=49278 RepID=A0A5C7B5Q6_9FLAO|nr:glycosyltransferase family 2 protein [Psychroserpens burtonensis]TXE17105.1 glycosyltransferase family 2 protein [Psychroserpens burtonensis]